MQYHQAIRLIRKNHAYLVKKMKTIYFYNLL